MASYLTKDEFLAQTIPGEAFEGLTDDQINKALSWASSKADSYLRKRYNLPMVSWGDDLREAVGMLAAYQLCRRVGFRPSSGYNEELKDANDEAIDWLLNVSKGLVEIEGADSTPLVDENGSLATSDPPLSFRFQTGVGRNRGPCCDD